ncbi:MAG: hypothetical protein LBD64_06275 [Odoribacteraceae bacterium]|jgi:hypothetical protein|nr:hypothetical protein [Odoribacteraceae bacterium]
MKRVISILLLLVLPVTAIRPTIAVHYCGGRIHAVGLAGEEIAAGCCPGEMEDERGQGDNVEDPGARCCITRVAEIKTDDGQKRALDAPRAPVTFLATRPAHDATPCTFARIHPRVSAPTGKHPPSTDLLTLISVARV